MKSGDQVVADEAALDTSAETGIFSAGKRSVKAFVLTMTILMMVTPLFIATMADLVASDGSILRGLAAAIVAFVGSALVGFFAGQKLAAAKVLQEAVAELAIGRKPLGAIFDAASGVSDDCRVETRSSSRNCMGSVWMMRPKF